MRDKQMPERSGGVIVDMTAFGSYFGAPHDFAGIQITPEDIEHCISTYAETCDLASFTCVTDHNGELGETITAIAKARHWFLSRPERFVLIEKADDVLRAKAEGKLAVSLNFQGTAPFGRDLRLVELYKRLGVTHALLAYNTKNAVADGCHERTDAGLSNFGLELIAEMNRVGMLVDVTHTGHRSAIEAIEASTAPVIMSHSSPSAVFTHPRNVPDDQIIAMAKTGGVMGIHGVGTFMSKDGEDISAQRIADFVDYAVQLVGARHIGLGIDWVIESVADAMAPFIKAAKSVYADESYRKSRYLFASPRVIGEIAEVLLRRNYAEADVRGILGENWMRVLRQVWG